MRRHPHPVVCHADLMVSDEEFGRSGEGVFFGVLVLAWHSAVIEALAPPLGGDGGVAIGGAVVACLATGGAQVGQDLQRAIGVGGGGSFGGSLGGRPFVDD